MLELKFAIYYRAASLPSEASYAVLAEESKPFWNTPHRPIIFLIDQLHASKVSMECMTSHPVALLQHVKYC